MTKLQRARRALMGDALAEWPVEDVERLGELLEQFADALDGDPLIRDHGSRSLVVPLKAWVVW